MKKLVLGLAALVAVFAFTLVCVNQSEAADAKTIKEVMKEAHVPPKDSLLKKVVGGEASKEEKAKLLSLYEAMAKQAPPQGDKEAWAKKTQAIVKAASAVAKGNEKALKRLGRATQCGGCHRVFKPK